MSSKEVRYELFAKYYVEIADLLNILTEEAEELDSLGEQVPSSLSSEIYRHEVILNILTQAGEEMYKKSPKQLYNDGWHEWNGGIKHG